MLFLGGRRELGAPPAVAEDAGEGVEVDIMSTAVERGDCISKVGKVIPRLMSMAIDFESSAGANDGGGDGGSDCGGCFYFQSGDIAFKVAY